MNRKQRYKISSEKLEPTILINGSEMPRCQAQARASGKQCKKAASRGYNVCRVHGAGSRKKVESGEKKAPGRPIEHGLYSKKGKQNIADLMDEVRALELNLDDTDQEMVTLKAVLWHLLEQADKFTGKAETVETALEAMQTALGGAEVVKSQDEADNSPSNVLSASDARALGRDIQTGYKMLSQLEGYSDRLSDTAVKVVTMVKARAETRAKLAEHKALEQFVKLAQSTRDIVWDVLPDAELIDVFEQRLRLELYGPNLLEMPERDKAN